MPSGRLSKFWQHFTAQNDWAIAQQVIRTAMVARLGVTTLMHLSSLPLLPPPPLPGTLYPLILWEPFLPAVTVTSFIISAIVVFSHYVILIPSADQKDSTLARTLFEHVIAYFRVPQALLSVSGTEFTSVNWKQLQTILRCSFFMTSPY